MGGNDFLLVLMYHQLFTDSPADRYSVRVDNFERQMARLSAEGYASVVPETFRGAGGKKQVMITFDDGYESDYVHALPILGKFGFNGISFVTTSYVGNPGYLRWEQVAALAKGGFSVQSHTHTHPLLEFCAAPRVAHELSHSKRLIESCTGTTVASISLPGGSFPDDILGAAESAGYRHVFSSIPGIQRLPADRGKVFPRFCVESRLSLEGFARVASGEAGAYRLSAAGYYLRCGIKRLIGRHAYHSLWRRFGKSAAAGREARGRTGGGGLWK